MLLPAVIKCEFSAGRENGKCDDSNNIYECDWDGGDCCGCFVENGICIECDCKDPNQPNIENCCYLELMVNGICDKENNNAPCQYDGLDCCSDIARLPWDSDYQCPLQENSCPMEKLINNECDADANTVDCLFDMGQCCNVTFASSVVADGSICDLSSDGKI